MLIQEQWYKARLTNLNNKQSQSHAVLCTEMVLQGPLGLGAVFTEVAVVHNVRVLDGLVPLDLVLVPVGVAAQVAAVQCPRVLGPHVILEVLPRGQLHAAVVAGEGDVRVLELLVPVQVDAGGKLAGAQVAGEGDASVELLQSRKKGKPLQMNL